MRKILKLKALEWSQYFPHYKSMGIFRNAQRQVTHKFLCRILLFFKPIRDIMSLLVACKNEEDPMKNEGARVVTTLFINFSDAHGQLTPKSVMKSCLNSDPSKLLWAVLSSARMKKIQSKMNELEWSHLYSLIFKMLKGS